MKRLTSFTVGLLLTVTLASCATATSVPPTSAPAQATATVEGAAEETIAAESTEEPVPFPLTEPGPYRVGVREFSAMDAGRDDREVGIRVWYPALGPEGATGRQSFPKAEPDRTGEPYPLIVSSAEMGSELAPDVVTHGFVWAGVTEIHTYARMNEQVIDQPLDILFALDQVASHPPEELVGMIDADHAGAIGYSFDGFNALVLSGARIDPAHYLAQCPNPDPTTEAILSSMSAFSCGPAGAWPILPQRSLATICRGARTWPTTFRKSLWRSTMIWPGACTRPRIERGPPDF
jgi:predicted dienelactone hydrolase